MEPQFLASSNTGKTLLKSIFLGLCLLFTGSAVAQNQEGVLGNWYGVLTQDAGGYQESYNVELSLSKKANAITGLFIVNEKKLTSTMEVKGEWLSSGRIKLHDVRLLKHKEPAGVNWCYKTYILDYHHSKQKVSLEGNWSGKTVSDKCVPGKVYLKRASPKA